MSLFSKEIRHKLAPVLKRHDIARAAIFGSFAVNQISEPEFFKLQQPQEAVIRRLEIIGKEIGHGRYKELGDALKDYMMEKEYTK